MMIKLNGLEKKIANTLTFIFRAGYNNWKIHKFIWSNAFTSSSPNNFSNGKENSEHPAPTLEVKKNANAADVKDEKSKDTASDDNMIAIIETIHKAIEPPEDVCSLAVSFDFSSFTSAAYLNIQENK
jgi:hypothetical protein